MNRKLYSRLTADSAIRSTGLTSATFSPSCERLLPAMKNKSWYEYAGHRIFFFSNLFFHSYLGHVTIYSQTLVPFFSFDRFFSLSLPFSFSRRFFREGGGEARASKEKKRGSVALCSQSNAQVARLPVFPPLNRRKEISSSKKEIERIPRKFKIFLPFISSSSVEMK